MAKREPDNLALDMMRCKKDGFGCHYGAWKAIHGDTKAVEVEIIPEGLPTCKRCGKPFKAKGSQQYCTRDCQWEAKKERERETYREYQRIKMANRRAERKLNNESNA